MKRIILFSLILAVLCSACTSADNTGETDLSKTQKPAQTQTITPTQTRYEDLQVCDTPPSGEIFVPWESIAGIPQIAYDMAVYSTLDELCSEAVYIFTAKIADVEVEIVGEEDWETDEQVYKTKVWYRLDVEQNIKGDIAANGDSSIYEPGFRYDDVNFFHEYFPPMCYGKTYLIFAYDNMRLCMPFVGYCEISDGKALPTEYNTFFGEGQPVGEIIQEITSITGAEAFPEELSADEGMQSLLQTISSEPDFAPARDMTKDEIDLSYRFYNDVLVEDFMGKELQNGDIVIWLNTLRLTQQQMKVYEETLGGATNAVIQEREEDGMYYKVTVTQYHTLITICKYNEDNATIHDAFNSVLNQANKYL